MKTSEALRGTVYALVGLTGLLVLGLTAIAVAQVATHQPINLPAGLTEALGAAVTAVLGGGLFLGHGQAINGIAQTMADLATNTVPVGNVSPLGTTTTARSAATTPSAPTGSTSGGVPTATSAPPGTTPSAPPT